MPGKGISRSRAGEIGFVSSFLGGPTIGVIPVLGLNRTGLGWWELVCCWRVSIGIIVLDRILIQ
jgi:hypothetical protein